MDIDLVFKIAAVGIVVAVLHQLLVREISSLIDLIKSLFGF